MFASGKTAAVASAANYIEEVFSTYLYTGNSSTQTITNGIDLSTKGGLVWIKKRSGGTADSHNLYDTDRGATKRIKSNLTDASVTTATSLTSFNSDGFSLGSSTSSNESPNPYVSWTFRKQPKFFDVVTWTGNGAGSRLIPHSLQSTPNCVIVKRTDAVSDWKVSHYSAANNYYSRLLLNSTAAGANGYPGGGVNPFATSTTVEVGTSWYIDMNATGGTYVAYLFAHDAGGFGLTGTDNVISCGSYTGTGTAGLSVTLGYEPQWLLVKNASSSIANWVLVDNMRGFSKSSTAALFPNLSEAEITWSPDRVSPNATGFTLDVGTDENLNKSGSTHIYIAIRRGPMKVPTSGTSVFIPLALNNASDTKNTTGFPVDLQFQKYRAGLNGIAWFDRLRGLSSVPSSQSATTGLLLRSSSTAAEVSTDNLGTQYGNTSFNTGGANGGIDMIYWNLRRAPSFFDVVCYTGTGVARTINHNLGVVPELMIVKQRSAIRDWSVYSSSTGATNALYLNTTAASSAASIWNSTAPTSSVFSLAGLDSVNASGGTFVAYLFATCAGVSKVGSYTGNGSSQTINCGFTSGARFVLIKATSAAGQWRVYDTARGIVAGNEPELFLNLTDAEQTVYDAIDTASSGFIVNSNGANVNDSGVTYIFLAIA